MFKKLFALLIAITFAISLAACDTDTTETVELGYVNWAEGVAMNYLAHAILEDEMGYEVESRMADAGPIYGSLASGNTDAFLDAWYPFTHQTYREEYGDAIVDLGYNFEGAKIGLVVPDYVTIDSIAEMNEYAEQFDGQIVGIDPGAGIMAAADDAVEVYNLTDIELQGSSGPVMVQALAEAIENEEWIVVTGWEPHFKFADYNLKFLDDPEGSFGESENIHTVARADLADDMPEVAQFLENFYLNSDQLGNLMGMMNEYGDEYTELEIARMWMEDNEDLVQSWLP